MNSASFNYTVDHSTTRDVETHLTEVSDSFTPPLASYVDIPAYSKKITDLTKRFEIWLNDKLIGLIAGYLNENSYFITNLSIDTKYSQFKIGYQMLNFCLTELKAAKVTLVELEVFNENTRAVKFYERNGFELKQTDQNKSKYMLILK